MTFDSLTFVVFLAAIFGGYWAVRSWTARKVFLLSASYLFYAAWNPFFVLLIMATTGFDWLASHWMDRVQRPSHRRAILASSIAINLGSLGFFKYAQFFADNAVDLLHVFGINFEPVSLGILLPVGISFYTFESLSYVIDVYRRRIAVSRSLLDYGLYVTFATAIFRRSALSPNPGNRPRSARASHCSSTAWRSRSAWPTWCSRRSSTACLRPASTLESAKAGWVPRRSPCRPIATSPAIRFARSASR
jgi:alginate O-acetyltransferase complex protein AlgI